MVGTNTGSVSSDSGGGGGSDNRSQQKRKDTGTTTGGTSSFLQCIFNLANILMGMGLLGLPYAYRAAGYHFISMFWDYDMVHSHIN